MNLGIVAGKGELPALSVKKAVEKGFSPVVVALEGFANTSDFASFDSCQLKVGEVKKIFDFFKTRDVTKIIFVGKVEKPKWSDLFVDSVGALLLAKILKNKLLGDDSIMQIINSFVQTYGFFVISAIDILGFVSQQGALTEQKPQDSDFQDIELGFKLAQDIGKFDVGQCVIVERGCVLGVEGPEGTNELIKRCGSLKRFDNFTGVLVKIAKPGQNLALDAPVIGIDTIANLHKAGFEGIAIEQNSVIVLDAQKVIDLANKLKIFIWVI